MASSVCFHWAARAVMPAMRAGEAMLFTYVPTALLYSGCRRVIAMMQHATKDGEAKLVARCNYPLTATGVVARVITELGVFDPTPDGRFTVVELAPDVTRDQVAAATGAPLA